jgi:GTP diphosphokinase / guanosine-3',5'-bis(diphosphate) 3'-diphosphatase
MEPIRKITPLREFLKEVKGFNPKANVKLIGKAYTLSKKAHRGEKRESGEPYLIHPIEVARILMELNVDSSTICAALLHDVLENTKITYDQLLKEFNKEIASLVEGLTNIEKFKFASREEYTNENIRKVLLASSKDIRIILIKLADRLHNMRTLKHKPSKRQKITAQITLHIFAPLAEKLGLWSIKGELEDLSLRYLEPKTYQTLKNKIGEKREEREKKTEEIVNLIQKELDKNKIKAKVFGRAKYFYSIYKKMKNKDKRFDQIFDLIGIRIITSKKEECYATLNIIHNLWPHKKTRFKDYIKYPKDNGYKSVHTTVFGPYNKILEIQIRDLKMHYEAEGGVAAHWRYAGTERDKEFDRRIQWFKQAIEWRRFSKNAKEFIENLKLDFYKNEIVILTPKGDPIPLPEGATPLDFAYELHTSIGNHCSAAVVNGKAVPLDYILKSGQIVNILTKEKAKPSRSWINIAKTNRAKSKIRHSLGLTKIMGSKQKPFRESKLSDMVKIKDPSIKSKIKMGSCCHPKLNNPLIGFKVKEDLVVVHRLDCPQISIFDQAKRVEVFWKIKETEKDFINFRIKIRDRVGLLSEILNVFSEYQLDLESVDSKISKKHVYIFIKTKKIQKSTLQELSKKLKSIQNVLDIFLS